MDLSQLKHLVFCFAVLIVVGCASVSKTAEYANPQSLELGALIGDAVPGDRVSLPQDNTLGVSDVVVGRTYTAASGRPCQRLLADDGTPIQRVVCKRSDGVWILARDLSAGASAGTAGPAVKMATSKEVIEQAVVQSASSMAVRVFTDETEDDHGAATNFYDADATEIVLPKSQTPTAVETVQRTVQINETLWSFAKRTTGSALNWETIAKLNGIIDAKTLATGTQLYVPAELVGHGG